MMGGMESVEEFPPVGPSRNQLLLWTGEQGTKIGLPGPWSLRVPAHVQEGNNDGGGGAVHRVPTSAFATPQVSNNRRPSRLRFGTGGSVSANYADPDVKGVSGGVVGGVAQTMVQAEGGGETAPRAVRAGNGPEGLTELSALGWGVPKMLPS